MRPKPLKELFKFFFISSDLFRNLISRNWAAAKDCSAASPWRPCDYMIVVLQKEK